MAYASHGCVCDLIFTLACCYPSKPAANLYAQRPLWHLFCYRLTI